MTEGRFLKKAEAYWEEVMAKWTAKQKMAQLSFAVKELRRHCSDRDGLFVSLALKHIDAAEQSLDAAVRHLQEDEITEANQVSEQGLVHARVSIHHLSAFKEEKFEPGFQEGGARHTVAAVSASLARTKMAVEYNNSVVDESIRKGLIGVAKMFNDAVDLVAQGEGAEAKRTAEGALLWLYELASEIELENRQPIVDGRALYKTTSKNVKRIRELCDKIVSAKRLFVGIESQLPEKIMHSIDEAQESYQNAIGAYMDQDQTQVDNLIHAGRMQIDKAVSTFESLAKTELSAQDLENKKAREMAHSASTFRKRVGILRKLLTNRAEARATTSLLRLDAALKYYNESHEALSRSDWAEAMRLSRAAHLDLDLARQILFSSGVPAYGDL